MEQKKRMVALKTLLKRLKEGEGVEISNMGSSQEGTLYGVHKLGPMLYTPDDKPGVRAVLASEVTTLEGIPDTLNNVLPTGKRGRHLECMAKAQATYREWLKTSEGATVSSADYTAVGNLCEQKLMEFLISEMEKV